MICETYEIGALKAYKYVVVLSTCCGKILLSRHRLRDTWETQGGHIEPGETPMQAACRELTEESGAVKYTIRPLCDYWAGDPLTRKGANGQVFAAEIEALGPLPQSEMAEVRAFDALPENLTYPAITPVLFGRLFGERSVKTILLGTTNPSKVRYFETLLSDAPVRFVTLRDLAIVDEPVENGRTPVENARIKAAFYGRYADAVICADSGLYFDSLPLDDPRQPGLHIRTPGGQPRLDDDQMIEYYAELAHELGGRVMAYYIDGLALKINGEVFGFQATREEALTHAFYLADTPYPVRREGWPLDSLSMESDGRYYLDPERKAMPQMQSGYKARLRAFLLEKLGFEKEE